VLRFQNVVLATSLFVEQEDEEDAVVIPTQQVPDEAESEEGEITPSPLVRCNAVAL
jgi:hypothetical protein